jgi:hypothetical protein
LKLPLAQPAQLRSAVALPAADTYCPAAHSVHAVQFGSLPVVENVPAEQTLPASVSFPPLCLGVQEKVTSEPKRTTQRSRDKRMLRM